MKIKEIEWIMKNNNKFFRKNFIQILNLISFIMIFFCVFIGILNLLLNVFKNDLINLNIENLIIRNYLSIIFYLIVIILGNFCLKIKNIFYFFFYQIFYLSLIIYEYINNNENKISFFLIRIIYKINNFLLIIGFLLIILYEIAYKFNLLEYTDDNFNFNILFHDFYLKTDMMKMAYNNLMIKIGIHKISKKLLFNKNDYYFMNINNKEKINNNENLKNNENNNNETKFNEYSSTDYKSYNEDEENENQPLNKI